MNWIQKFSQKMDQHFSFLEKTLIYWGLFWSLLGFSLYFLGLISLFYRSIVMIVTIGWVILFLYLGFRFELFKGLKEFLINLKAHFAKDWLSCIFLAFLIVFILLNLLSVLAPEIGYDAIWYHLTLPKIYLMTHQIRYLLGETLYYSVMPRLAEMFFSAGLAFDSSGVLSKVIHFFFGLTWFTGVYVFGRLFLARRTSILVALIVFGTITVSWLSQTAYIDLIVSFFVVLSLINLFKFWEKGDNFYLILGSVFMGFNLASKIYGLAIFGVLSIFLFFKSGWKKTLIFVSVSLIFVLPFYLQAYLATGNPIFPVGAIKDSALDNYLAGYHTIKDWLFNAWLLLLPRLLWKTLFYSFTPFLGLILLLPLVSKWRDQCLSLSIFLVFFIFWSVIPFQDLRYFLPILPLGALLIGFIYEKSNSRVFKIIFIIFVLIFLSSNLFKLYEDYKKSISVVFRQETTLDYLKENVPLTRNFYDSDNYFARNIKPTDKVLTTDLGNLFYVNFPFYDWDFIENTIKLDSGELLANNLKNKNFTHILVGSKNTKSSLSDWLSQPKNGIDKYFEIVYQNEYFKLYRIK